MDGLVRSAIHSDEEGDLRVHELVPPIFTDCWSATAPSHPAK